MNLILRYKLSRLSQRGKPSKDFVDTLQQKLIDKGAYAPPMKAGVQPVMMRFAAAALSIVILFSIGTSAYAYSSDEVTPDHPLYGLRQAVEVAEEAVAVTPAWKERVIRKHLERKQKEIEKMLERRPGLRERPEGQVLVKVEKILEEGVAGKREPGDVRDSILAEVREAQKEILRPAARLRLKRIERRLELMQRLKQDGLSR